MVGEGRDAGIQSHATTALRHCERSTFCNAGHRRIFLPAFTTGVGSRKRSQKVAKRRMTNQQEGGEAEAAHGAEHGVKTLGAPTGQREHGTTGGPTPKKGYFRKPKNWISLLTLIFVGAYTVINALMWRTTNKQLTELIRANKLSQASFVATQRAYISYDGVNSLKDEISTGTFRYSISPKLVNSGNTSTKDMTMKVNCWLDPHFEAEPFDDFRSQNLDITTANYGPHVSLQAIECHYTSEQAKAIAEQKLHSYMAADVRYKDFVDPDGREHVTQFALEFIISNIDSGGGLIGGVAQRGKHNCADENCSNQSFVTIDNPH
jgi:hypothetical protein